MRGKELQVGGPPPQVRLAGALVGLQGLAGVGVAVAILVRAMAAGALSGALLGEIGFFLLIGGAVLAVGAGLLRGRRWARSPAIVTQLLLLPVVYSLLGPSRQLLLGVLAGVVRAGHLPAADQRAVPDLVDGPGPGAGRSAAVRPGGPERRLPSRSSAAPSSRNVVHSSIPTAPSAR